MPTDLQIATALLAVLALSLLVLVQAALVVHKLSKKEAQRLSGRDV